MDETTGASVHAASASAAADAASSSSIHQHGYAWSKVRLVVLLSEIKVAENASRRTDVRAIRGLLFNWSGEPSTCLDNFAEGQGEAFVFRAVLSRFIDSYDIPLRILGNPRNSNYIGT